MPKLTPACISQGAKSKESFRHLRCLALSCSAWYHLAFACPSSFPSAVSPFGVRELSWPLRLSCEAQKVQHTVWSPIYCSSGHHSCSLWRVIAFKCCVRTAAVNLQGIHCLVFDFLKTSKIHRCSWFRKKNHQGCRIPDTGVRKIKKTTPSHPRELRKEWGSRSSVLTAFQIAGAGATQPWYRAARPSFYLLG